MPDFRRLAIWYSRYAPGSSRSKNKPMRFLHCLNLESILEAGNLYTTAGAEIVTSTIEVHAFRDCIDNRDAICC